MHYSHYIYYLVSASTMYWSTITRSDVVTRYGISEVTVRRRRGHLPQYSDSTKPGDMHTPIRCAKKLPNLAGISCLVHVIRMDTMTRTD